MLTRRSVVGGALACGGTALLAPSALAMFQGTTPARTPLRLGIYSQTIFNLPLWVAEERGYFTDAGIEFMFDKVDDMGTATAAVLDGSAPIGGAGPEVSFLDRKAGGDRVAIIAGNANRLPHFLIAKPKYKTIADLKGARIGVISEKEGTTYVFQKMAARAGLKRSDYEIAAVGSAPTRVKLMDQGEIDAGLQPFPLSYEAEAKGFSNLGWSGSVEPEWQFSVINANRRWLDDNIETAAAFLEAKIRGRHFMTKNPDATAEIVSQRLGTRPEFAKRAVSDMLRLGILHPDLRWSPAGMQAVHAILQQTGSLPPGQFDARYYVDGRAHERGLQQARRRGV